MLKIRAERETASPELIAAYKFAEDSLIAHWWGNKVSMESRGRIKKEIICFIIAQFDLTLHTLNMLAVHR